MPFDAEDRPPSTRASRRPAHAIFVITRPARGGSNLNRRYGVKSQPALTGKPDTFRFLGFTHICGSSRSGHFKPLRITDSKRMRAKLSALKGKIERRRHLPIPVQGHWLASVLRGHANYYGVPGNQRALYAFRSEAVRLWFMALRRRSQRTTVTWERMRRFRARWLPFLSITQPWPDARFDARTQGRSPVR
jgi:RNA-directed DNA polymerase